MWNIIDWANMVTFMLFILRYWVAHKQDLVYDESIRGNCELSGTAFVDGNSWNQVNGSYAWQLAVVVALTFLRTLKYSQISPAVQVPFMAFIGALWEILALFVVLFIVCLAFAWLFYIRFNYMAEFSSVTEALGT